jgi:hypothetical protein
LAEHVPPVGCDQPGALSVEVAKHAGAQNSPSLPNLTTDKFSGAAHMILAGAFATGVSSSWTTAVAQCDTIQYKKLQYVKVPPSM